MTRAKSGAFARSGRGITAAVLVAIVAFPSPAASRGDRPQALPGSVRLARSARVAAAGPVPAGWLEVVNYYRSLAYLNPVNENLALSDGDRKHARYMVENQIVEHDEVPGQPYYTTQGDAAAHTSNLMSASSRTTSERAAVETWILGPFHGIGILDPRLVETGYGEYSEARNSGFEFAAALDVLSNRTGPAPSEAVMFPGDGTKIFLGRYPGGEYPNPLSHCGWAPPSGPPVYLQLPAPAPLESAQFEREAATGDVLLDSCVYDGSTYLNFDGTAQQTGREVLAGRNAIILMPRAPLKSNKTYNVAIFAGSTEYAWSFSVGDVTPPKSRIEKPDNESAADQDRLGRLAGTASRDTARVDIALAQFFPGSSQCRFWTGSGFTPKKSCGNEKWLRANGTADWAYPLASKLPASIPQGNPPWNYLMWSRAQDRVGNIESGFQYGRNNIAFHVLP